MAGSSSHGDGMNLFKTVALMALSCQLCKEPRPGIMGTDSQTQTGVTDERPLVYCCEFVLSAPHPVLSARVSCPVVWKSSPVGPATSPVGWSHAVVMLTRLIPMFFAAVAMAPLVVMVTGQSPTEQELQQAVTQAKAEVAAEEAAHVSGGAEAEENPFSGALNALASVHRSTPMARELSRCATVLEKVAKHFISRRRSYTIVVLFAINSRAVTSVCDATSMETITCPTPAVPEFRSANGRCNNRNHPLWGSSEEPLRRLLEPEYGDGLMTPRIIGRNGTPLPSARLVSTTMHEDLRKSSPVNTHMVMQFGQFLDHDITLTPSFQEEGLVCTCDSEDERCFNIDIPSDDPDFAGRPCLPFVRSLSGPNEGCRLGRRQQLNELTAFVDASNVYGSSDEEIEELREHADPGCSQKATDTTYRYRWDLPQLTGTRFTFQVSANNDAFIGLSPENHDVTNMYEIVIGIISPTEYRTFWINLAPDGTISVGKGGVSQPFMSWRDPNPIRVSYAGYSTGWGATGRWKFCSNEDPGCSQKATDTTYRYRWDLPQLTGTRFTFQVSANNDAFIGLSPENHDVTNMYEIVIGIISPTEYRTFWINLAPDGTISVGKGGVSQPFMSWRDPNPIRVSYAGYSTGWGATGRWKFCSNEDPGCSQKATDTTYRYRWDLPQLTGTRFTFQVSANNDAFIGLSPENHDVTNMYEIVIGGWSNTKSAIRRRKQGESRALVSTPGIISPTEYRTFWINLAPDGTISVGKGGVSQPFMSWRDPNPIRVSYAGYSTGWGATGRWKFCSNEEARGLLKSRPNPADENKKELLPGAREPDLRDPCDEFTGKETCSLAGDIRVNEQPGLTSMHTVFLREHNRIARRLSGLNPYWDDDRVFFETRKIVGALMQKITYGEDLPHVLGPAAMTKFHLTLLQSGFFSGYDASVNPTISNVFATAAYRFGHSLVNNLFQRYAPDFNQGSSYPIQLPFAFFNPSHIFNSDQGGPDSILRGLTAQPHQDFDRFMVSGLTKKLFAEPPGSDRGLDLAALNIQRGRDHGLPGYNAWRVRCGLPKANSFDELVFDIPDPYTRTRLEDVYSHVDDIDVFVGGLAEESVRGGVVGPTFACLIGLQFQALRKGDRFWFENDGQFTAVGSVGSSVQRFRWSDHICTQDWGHIDVGTAQLAEIRKTSLARILCDNTDGTTHMQPDVFRLPTQTGNERVACSSLPQMDLTKWQESQANSRGLHESLEGENAAMSGREFDDHDADEELYNRPLNDDGPTASCVCQAPSWPSSRDCRSAA
ncbi:hypothetical protein Bbelb_029340 [Branchiostoma belcheri]|nr:hypothetical protein Bbelb_029340 [Branchiostoma belcheri]